MFRSTACRSNSWGSSLVVLACNSCLLAAVAVNAAATATVSDQGAGVVPQLHTATANAANALLFTAHDSICAADYHCFYAQLLRHHGPFA
jgi:hypothetical protein